MVNIINQNGLQAISFTKLNRAAVLRILKYRNSDTVRIWMKDPEPISQSDHLNFVKKLATDKNKFYYLVKEKGEDIGIIYLTQVDEINKNAYLGIYTNPFSINSGKGSKCMNILLTIAFDIMKLHTLKLEVMESNIRAIKLYEKFNFIIEGKLREVIYFKGNWTDLIIMGLIKPNNIEE